MSRKRWGMIVVICVFIIAVLVLAIFLLQPHLNRYADAWYV